MAKKGDQFKIKLKKAHLGWGDYRHTDTREPIEGEAYIPIPAPKAREFNLYNGNGVSEDLFGANLFNCISEDGTYSGVLRAQGGSKEGAVHAKQFSEDGNLKGIGEWYNAIGAQEGDEIEVVWDNETYVRIKKL